MACSKYVPMAASHSPLTCFTCLAYERTLSPLGFLYRTFLLMIGDTWYRKIFPEEDNMNIQVCWECKATIQKSFDFVQRMTKARILRKQHHLTLSGLGRTSTTHINVEPKADHSDQYFDKTTQTLYKNEEPTELIFTDVQNQQMYFKYIRAKSRDVTLQNSLSRSDTLISQKTAKDPSVVGEELLSEVSLNNEIELDQEDTITAENTDCDTDSNKSFDDKSSTKMVIKLNDDNYLKRKHTDIDNTKETINVEEVPAKNINRLVLNERFEKTVSILPNSQTMKTHELYGVEFSQASTSHNIKEESTDTIDSHYSDSQTDDSSDIFQLQPYVNKSSDVFNCYNNATQELELNHANEWHDFDSSSNDTINLGNNAVEDASGIKEFTDAVIIKSPITDMLNNKNPYVKLVRMDDKIVAQYLKSDNLHVREKQIENNNYLQSYQFLNENSPRLMNEDKLMNTIDQTLTEDMEENRAFNNCESKTSTETEAPAKDYSFACNECDKKFLKEPQLRLHVDFMHSGVTKNCQLCNRIFLKQSALELHQKVAHGLENNNKRKYQCAECNKIFSTKLYLEDHITTHSGSRRHRCQLCGFATHYHTSLFSHMRSVHKTPLKRKMK